MPNSHALVRVQKPDSQNDCDLSWYVVDGIDYGSSQNLADNFGVKKSLIDNRRTQGRWTAERAVKTPEREPVRFGDEIFPSYHALWEEHGQREFSTFLARKKLGYDLPVCLQKERPEQQKNIIVNGEKFASVASVARRFGTSPSRLHQVMKSENLTLGDAVNFVAPPNGKYSNSFFEKHPEIAKQIGKMYLSAIQFPGEELNKIGVTRKTISGRHPALKYEILGAWAGPLWQLYKIEQLVLQAYSSKLKRAPLSFDGRCETFLLTKDEQAEMLNAISKIMSDYGYPAISLSDLK